MKPAVANKNSLLHESPAVLAICTNGKAGSWHPEWQLWQVVSLSQCVMRGMPCPWLGAAMLSCLRI